MKLKSLNELRRLTTAGLSSDQAEAIADAFKEAQTDSQPLTRDYFDSRLRAEIEAAKADIIKWLASLLIAQAAVVAALVRLL